MLRTCMTFALIIIASVWGWKAVLHFLSIDPIMVVFGIYAACFTPRTRRTILSRIRAKRIWHSWTAIRDVFSAISTIWS